MIRALKIIGLLVLIVAIGAMGFFSLYQGKTSPLPDTQPFADEDLIQRGAYLAKVGDCAACHTSDQGSFAGGTGLDSGTPVGIIYPSNITSDPETGIGRYTLKDFDNAMRYGLKRSGDSLYPAMPYPSFASVSSDDIEALYAYFMHGVEPVRNQVKPTDASWPLTMNWPVNAWRLFFAPEVTSLTTFTAHDNPNVRGAYLIEGLGHCSTCHTPRNAFMAEESLHEDGSRRFLSGGPSLEGWNGVNLRGDDMDGLGRMSHDQLVQLLKTGRNDQAAVFGSMGLVVQDSLQYLEDADLHAMASYLKALPPAKPNGPAYAYDASTHQALANGEVSVPGALTYLNNCAGCHRSDGKGYAETFPTLAGNAAILNDNADSLISLILRGSHMLATVDAPTEFAMLGSSWRLDDQEITDLANFIRSSWGNQALKVSQNRVAKLRQQYINSSTLEYQRAQINSIPTESYTE